MEYKAQIGRVAFLIDTPAPYNWKEADLEFLKWDGTAETLVRINIYFGEAVVPDRKPDTSVGETEIWQESQTQIRAYHAVFWPGHPMYAVSSCCADRVDVVFCGDMSLWNHPNMLLWNLIHLEQFLLKSKGVVLHACYTVYQGKAILFSAPSGTGKTTQAELWKHCFGAEIINGDKCLLNLTDGEWMACGYPYHGSADECENRKYPIAGIAIVRQAETDWVEPVGPAQAAALLYSESTINSWDREKIDGALSLIFDLVTKVPVIKLHCTMKDSAAGTLHAYLFGGKYGTV